MPNPHIEKLYEHTGALADREQQAKLAGAEISDDSLASTDLEVLVNAILDRFAAKPVEAHIDQISMTTREMRSATEPPAPGTMAPIIIELTVPCSGAASLLMDARVFSSSHAQGHEYHGTIQVQLGGEASEADWHQTLEQWKNSWLDAVRAATITANATISEHRDSLATWLRDVIGRRQARIRSIRNAARSLEISLEPVKAPNINIPVRPSLLTLEQVERAAADGASEFMLAETISTAVVDTIISFATAVERLPQTTHHVLSHGGEESIRDILLFILNANWRGLATGETFIGIGKSDILLRWRDRDAFTGECKIWDGAQHLTEAIDQLLGRYLLWRNTHAALIVFIKNRKQITSILESARSAIISHPQYLGKADMHGSSNHETFAMAAGSDSRRSVSMTFIPVVIPDPSPEINQSETASAKSARPTSGDPD